MLKNVWQQQLELLYPQRCLLCKVIVEGKLQICPACLMEFTLRFVQPEIVPCNHMEVLILGIPYAKVRQVLHAAKFEGRATGLSSLAQGFSVSWCVEHTQYLEALAGVQLHNCLATTMPTDHKRRLQRGYDIPELLFSPWLEKQGIEYRRVLRRTRSTKPQFSLSRLERLDNVIASIEVTQELMGRNILLLDDIFTTGASMNEAARLLKLHGARRVIGIALASDLD